MIIYKKYSNWADQVLDRTDGPGVDQVGGPNTLPQSISTCRIGGHVEFIGVLSGPIPTMALLSRQVTLQGMQVGTRQQPIVNLATCSCSLATSERR